MRNQLPPEHRDSWDLKDTADVAELSSRLRASNIPEGSRHVTMPKLYEPTRKKQK